MKAIVKEIEDKYGEWDIFILPYSS
jgi:hypothetical protein